jgi:hypothetical protein
MCLAPYRTELGVTSEGEQQQRLLDDAWFRATARWASEDTLALHAAIAATCHQCVMAVMICVCWLTLERLLHVDCALTVMICVCWLTLERLLHVGAGRL